MRDDSESGDDLVFLSPPEGPVPEKPDTGASPRLRRSSRKRKSTADPVNKESHPKKKRNSTGNKGADMPRTARTPAKDGQPKEAQTPKEGTAGPTSKDQASSLENLLAGMESRLASKIDSTNSKVEKALDLVAEANTALDDLEMRVIATEKKIEERLVEVENRLEEKMNSKIKTLVLDQLRHAGFDPNLTVGALSSVAMSKTSDNDSYTAALTKTPSVQVTVVKEKKAASQQERQEEKFCLLYTSPSPRDRQKSRMPSSA